MASATQSSASSPVSGRRSARRPNDSMKLRMQSSSFAPDGWQPTTMSRRAVSSSSREEIPAATVSKPSIRIWLTLWLV